jgi:probable HAF family extracellular repeat protein
MVLAQQQERTTTEPFYTVKNLGRWKGLQGESSAFGINGAGQVVGWSGTVNNDHAFLYQDGNMIDLNSLIPPDSGWVFAIAQDINDKGQLVGWGYKTNVGKRAFLLTPVSTDTTPPKTAPSGTTADGNTYTSGKWTNQNITLTLTANDEGGSGVDKIFYNTDASTSYQEYTAPRSVTSAGITSVSYYATDKVATKGRLTPSPSW